MDSVFDEQTNAGSNRFWWSDRQTTERQAQRGKQDCQTYREMDIQTDINQTDNR